MIAVQGHLHHHGRFYAALGAGGAAYAIASLMHGLEPAALSGDVFFATYLAGSAAVLAKETVDQLKRRAARQDEGILVVFAIALAAIAFNVAGIFIALNRHQRLDALSLAVVLAAAPLGWLVLHTIYAFHYANLHYHDPPGGEGASRALLFPGTREPELWDFVYFSFVIGMTAQVSDVQICSRHMRRAVTGHAITAFLFNTVLIALAVNAAVAQAG